MTGTTRRPAEAGAELLEALRRAGVERRRRLRAGPGALLLRRLALPRAAPGRRPAPAPGRDRRRRSRSAGSLGVPLTARGAGTSIAGNAVGPGRRRRHQPAPGTACSTSTPRRARRSSSPASSRRRCRRAARPHGLRFGPDPSTHNRCTIGGMIGNNACGSRALGYGRTSDNVVGLDVVTGSGARLRLGPAAGRADASRADACSPRCAASSTPTSATIRTELGRFGRQVSGYSLEHLLPERGFDVARALVGSEGTLALVLGRHRARWSPTRRTAVPGRARLPLDGRRRRRDPGAAAAPAHRRRGAGLPHRAAAARRARRRRPRPAARRGLADRRARRRRRRRGGRHAPCAWSPTPARWTPSSSPTPPQAAAIWRIREDGAGPRRRAPATGAPRTPAGRTPPSRVERLGAYLREFEDAARRSTACRACPTGTSATAACTCASTSRSAAGPSPPTAAAPPTAPSSRTPPGWWPATAGRCPASTATAGPAASCCRTMYSAAAIALFERVKGAVRPRRPAQPRRARAPGPAGRGRAGRRRRAAAGRAWRWPTAHDGGDFSAAVHRCTGVGKCRADLPATGGVMCPSYPATREEKDSTRGRARVLQEMLAPGGPVHDWRSPEVHDALDLCLSCKGCSRDCPTGVDMATYKAEVLHQTYRRRLRPALALHARAAAALGRPGRAGAARWSTPCWRSRLGGRLAKWSAGVDQRRDAAAVRPRDLPAAVGRPAPAAGGPAARRWRCGWTRSPTTSPRRWRWRPCGCWRPPATACRSRPTTPAAR